MTEVMLVCLADNAASKKTILRCGGQLTRRFGPEDSLKEEFRICLWRL